MKWNSTVAKPQLQRPLSREELAWAGGFFAGEGWSGAYVKGRRRNLYAGVTQDYDPELVERFWESIGLIGTVKLERKKNDNGFGNGATYLWYVAGFEQVQFVIVALWPWLGDYKQEQYTTALKKWIG